MSKKNSKHLKYALVVIDGQAWDFHVPSYLLGRLNEGDKVVIRRDGWFGVGEVECLMASTKHSEANVRTIVDKNTLRSSRAGYRDIPRKRLEALTTACTPRRAPRGWRTTR